MERFAGRVAVVTGSSSGIGAGIAEALVRAGLVVAAVARRKDNLERLAASLSGEKGKLVPVQGDLSSVEDIERVFKWIDDNLGGVSILVNNAAMLHNEAIQDVPPAKSAQIVNTNVTAMMVGCTLAVDSMKRHDIRDGHIILMNSVAGHKVITPPPGIEGSFVAYTTTKHATVALAKGLHFDVLKLKGFKIRVTSISPGAVLTDMLPADFAAVTPDDGVLKVKDIVDATLYVLSCPPSVQISELTIQAVLEAV